VEGEKTGDGTNSNKCTIAGKKSGTSNFCQF
jgi:hypothetical protein